MSNTNKNNIKRVLQIFIVIILLIVAGCAGFFFSQNNNNGIVKDENAVEWNGEQSLPKPTIGNSPAIEIPGFKEVVFIANQTTQYVNFYNPKYNGCCFQMNLYVDDELLWKSGNIVPGDGYYKIELNRPFNKTGVAEGCLKIKCFKEDGTELNSATVNFKITIIEQGD